MKNLPITQKTPKIRVELRKSNLEALILSCYRNAKKILKYSPPKAGKTFFFFSNFLFFFMKRKKLLR